MEEVEGFEPPRGLTRLLVFKTNPFSRTWVYLQNKGMYIFKRMIGMTGFEPTTPWSQTKCSTKLSYIPYLNGALDRTWTYNLLIRSQMLYPIELRTHDNDSF